MGQTQLVYKVGWDIGENLGQAKVLKFFIFFLLLWVCFFIMGFQWV
jgi:hypothetical protein